MKDAAPFGGNSAWVDLRLWLRQNWRSVVAMQTGVLLGILTVRYLTGEWPF
jgi:hypothetical protein